MSIWPIRQGAFLADQFRLSPSASRRDWKVVLQSNSFRSQSCALFVRRAVHFW